MSRTHCVNALAAAWAAAGASELPSVAATIGQPAP